MQRGWKMLTDGFPAPPVQSEEPFPLGPFPRHVWIHDNTPQDSLDKACHKIWKRVQGLSEELQPALCSEPSETLRRENGNSQHEDGLLGETEGLESIYRAVIGNREREMKLRALCEAQLSAKSTITNLLCSAKSHKNSTGPEDSSTPGACSTGGSKVETPGRQKHTDTAKGPDNQAMAEEPKAANDFLQSSMFSSVKDGTPASAPPPPAEITTATPDKKNIKYSASTFTPRFSITTTTTVLNQLVWPSLSFPPLPVLPNPSSFSQFQIDTGAVTRRDLGEKDAKLGVAPYNPQHIFQPPYPPLLNYIPLVQMDFPYQQRTLPKLPTNIQDPPTAGDGTQYPFPPSYR
ncbi:uncharacterized protein C1orf94 homolog [Oxyura jamaicensis]|uniref:uncharacterized protein C1orf94 homolog n=1 Tax=Oxyura jamaicensis TaxID=8884 RepID=UPI0015A6F7C2|nr:uncharacterized protein C1orf94 homolog [Oxyura jamaicensis]